MKVFITFISIFIISVWALLYQGDMGVYNHEQLLLKEISEEISSGASLYIDDEQFSTGKIVFNIDEGNKYAEKFIEKSKMRSKLLKSSEIEYELIFEDDVQGFSRGNIDKIPAITAIIKLKSDKDIFKIPFIQVYEITRTSRYELPYLKI